MILLNDFYKAIFGCKTYKVSLDAGCTCPNRDGTKGTGGCIFCSYRGSGDFIKNVPSIKQQFASGIELIWKKTRGRGGLDRVKYIPYFQAFTSTYGDSSVLKHLYIEATEQENVAGLAVATRPDCITDEILEIFKELSEKTFLQVELGLQTSNENTGLLINRCYSDSDYLNTVLKLKKAIPSVHIVTHLIFGLPGETEKDMMNSLEYVIDVNSRGKNLNKNYDDFWGIKLTNLYVLKDTVLGKMYELQKYVPMEEDEYFDILEKALKKLPANCVIHRLTGDPPKKDALAPFWCLNKKKVLDRVNRMLKNT